MIDYREPSGRAKGKSEPGPGLGALEARSRHGVDLAEARRAAVRRERELDLLRDALTGPARAPCSSSSPS